jgi:hypothetical protein
MAKQPPAVHGKNPQTGKGAVAMPPNPKAPLGPSKHTPVTGKS